MVMEFEKYYEKELVRTNANSRNLRIIKIILRKKNIEMTAFNTVSFNRGYVLSLFGALFTYGLLFITIENK